MARIKSALESIGVPVHRAVHDANRGNFRVARCIAAGLSVVELEKLRQAFVAERPGAAGSAHVKYLAVKAYENNRELGKAVSACEAALELDPLNLGYHQRYVQGGASGQGKPAVVSGNSASVSRVPLRSWLGRTATTEVLALWAICFGAILLANLFSRPAAKLVATAGFLYLPLWAMEARQEDYRDYGLSLTTWKSDVRLFLGVSALAFPSLHRGCRTSSRGSTRSFRPTGSPC